MSDKKAAAEQVLGSASAGRDSSEDPGSSVRESVADCGNRNESVLTPAPAAAPTPKEVPQWVTSWPEWFDIPAPNSVTVVPKDDYDAALRDLAAARAERDDLKHDMERLQTANSEQLAELEAARKDAERYRWLRGRISGESYRVIGIVYSEGGTGIDLAIDAAMRQEKP